MTRMKPSAFVRKLIPTAAALLVLSGCATNNNFSAPAFPFPDSFRTDMANPAGSDVSRSLGDLNWKQIYTDAPLQELITEALQAGP